LRKSRSIQGPAETRSSYSSISTQIKAKNVTEYLKTAQKSHLQAEKQNPEGDQTFRVTLHIQFFVKVVPH
jgi:hypothetical protein